MAKDLKPHKMHDDTSTHNSISSSVSHHLNKFFAIHQNTLPEPGLYQTVINEVEQVLIKATLDFCDNNQSKTSHILGINRNTLRKKIEQFNLKG